MRHRRALALLLAAGMLCSGCSTGAISSNYRAVEDLELIQTIGVDRAPEGVCLSAATGKACENEAPKRMTQSGVSMLAALDQLQDRTPSAGLFYAQTSYLLLGEEAAAAGGLTPLLDFIARDPDMRLSAPLFIVRGGTAQQAVMETGDDKTDVTEALAALDARLEEAASDYEKYSALYTEKEAQEQKLTELMERWEALAAEAGE